MVTTVTSGVPATADLGQAQVGQEADDRRRHAGAGRQDLVATAQFFTHTADVGRPVGAGARNRASASAHSTISFITTVSAPSGRRPPVNTLTV